MGKNVLAGLALTTHNNSLLNSTLFEDVTVPTTPVREDVRPAVAHPSR